MAWESDNTELICELVEYHSARGTFSADTPIGTGVAQAGDWAGTATAAVPVEAALGKGITDVATIQKAISSPAAKFVTDPRTIVAATKAMQAYQVSLGTLDKEAPTDGLFDAKPFDAVKKP